MVAVSSPFRATANLLGLAWWARIDTRNPDVTYWFGPFVRRGSLERELGAFMADLRAEQPGVVEHQICLLYTSPSPRDYAASRMPSSA